MIRARTQLAPPTPRSRSPFRRGAGAPHLFIALSSTMLGLSCGPQQFHTGGEEPVVLTTDAVMDGDMAIPVVPEGLTASEAGSGPPSVVFLNFDGVTLTEGGWSQDDAAANTSFIVSGALAVPAFDHRPWGTDRAAVIAAVVAGVRDDFASWGVQVTSTRPASGRYTMLVFGGTPDLIGKRDTVIGLAPLDADNWNQSDVGFVFSELIAEYKYTTRQMAWVASHELGHTIGLRHITPKDDIMSPAACHCSQRWGAGPLADEDTGEQDDFALLSTAYGVTLVPEQDGGTHATPDAGVLPPADGGTAGPNDAGSPTSPPSPPLPPAPSFEVSLVSVKGTYKPITGDFDGDGIGDVFWYAPGRGADSVWFGNSNRQFTSVSKTVNGSYTPVVGDFNGDGTTDIYWYAPGSGADTVWFGQRNRTTRSAAWPQAGTFTPITGDFNGDGTADIFFYAPGTATDELWLTDKSGGVTRKLFNVDAAFVPATGDFNDDGLGDIYWYGNGAHLDEVWFGQPGGVFNVISRDSLANVSPLVGDFNGDGTADIAWYGAGAAADAIDFGHRDGQFARVWTGLDGAYDGRVGDFNGDGQSDILWYSALDGASLVWGGTPGGAFSTASRSFISSAKLLVADFDGDGASDIFLYGPGALADRLAWGRP